MRVDWSRNHMHYLGRLENVGRGRGITLTVDEQSNIHQNYSVAVAKL